MAVPSVPIPADSQVRVHFIDVGQADAIYIQLPDNNDILIDGGNMDDGPRVVDYLKAQGMDDDLELLIATHPHEDHIGGLPDILAAFQVEEILDCGLGVQSNCYELYKQAAEAENCTWHADDHQTFNFGGVVLQILTGDDSWSDLNNYSVVARLDCGEVEFLFSGDAEEEAELILAGDISSEILKVGHHGSTSSSKFDFLTWVQPQIAIISVGAGNDYDHPTSKTLANLQAAGVNIYRTDLNGNVVVTTDGSTYEVFPTKNYR